MAHAFPIHPDTQAFLDRQHRMLIGADWCAASDGATLQLVNPANGQALAQVPAATAQDVDRAVRAARDRKSVV